MSVNKINPHTLPHGVKLHRKDLKTPFIPVAKPQVILEGVGMNYSSMLWGFWGAIFITLIFYFIQVLGMQSWSGPWYFMKAKWYFILPLILSFALQMGLFRAIHLQAKRAGAVLSASGGVSTTAMIACCLHNLVLVLPILGLSGVAIFFSVYQNYVFMFSLLFSLGGLVFMWRKYLHHRANCKLSV